MHIGLFNDSFPPMIDGVAQTVKNYARVLAQRDGCQVTVVTPAYKGVRDEYPFEVYRYWSVNTEKMLGYRMGYPYAARMRRDLKAKHFDLIHIHSPFISSLLVHHINKSPRVPVILTYHTKFEVDIYKRAPFGFAGTTLAMMKRNLKGADEVWAVTEGCIQSLRNVGYKGDCRVMENGTDFAYGKADADAVAALRAQFQIPDDAFVLLYVGRMMWYKNIQLILDMLKIARGRGLPFRALMVGPGMDEPEIRAYAQQQGLSDCVTFPGAVYDREALRVYYSMADMFLFPSTYDTSGIVVKEAAACDCPSLLVRGSCAAEGVEDGVTGFLAEENPEDCARALLGACGDKESLRAAGAQAGQKIYLSWDDAVDKAYKRYEEILKGR